MKDQIILVADDDPVSVLKLLIANGCDNLCFSAFCRFNHQVLFPYTVIDSCPNLKDGLLHMPYDSMLKSDLNVRMTVNGVYWRPDILAIGTQRILARSSYASVYEWKESFNAEFSRLSPDTRLSIYKLVC